MSESDQKIAVDLVEHQGYTDVNPFFKVPDCHLCLDTGEILVQGSFCTLAEDQKPRWWAYLDPCCCAVGKNKVRSARHVW